MFTKEEINKYYWPIYHSHGGWTTTSGPMYICDMCGQHDVWKYGDICPFCYNSIASTAGCIDSLKKPCRIDYDYNQRIK